MYARSTTIRGNPEKIDEGIAYVRDTVMPAVLQMDGCVGLSMLVDRESGRAITTTAWADAQAMRMSADKVLDIRARAAEIVGGEAEVNEWEIAVMHRMRDAGDGACARVIWSTGDRGQMDRLVDTFRMSMVPRVEELPGFCSVSLLVDREGGRTVTAVTYESRDAMDRAREQGMALRQDFSNQMGSEVTEVAAFDVVLAHLRVPETV
jgi:quinol monooxygenase YgiN